jgi:hypothetical protein
MEIAKLRMLVGGRWMVRECVRRAHRPAASTSHAVEHVPDLPGAHVEWYLTYQPKTLFSYARSTSTLGVLVCRTCTDHLTPTQRY